MDKVLRLSVAMLYLYHPDFLNVREVDFVVPQATSRQCISLIEEKFDIFGATCYLPEGCGKIVKKQKFANGFLDDYYLCQRYDEKNVVRATEISYKTSEMMLIFQKIYFMHLPDISVHVVEENDGSFTLYNSLVNYAGYPPIHVDELCVYNTEIHKTFYFTDPPTAAFIWWTAMQKPGINDLLRFPFSLTFVDNHLSPQSDWMVFLPNCKGINRMRVILETNRVYALEPMGENPMIMQCLEKSCSLHTTAGTFEVKMGDFVVYRVHGECMFESENGNLTIPCYDSMLMVLNDTAARRPLEYEGDNEKLCGYMDLPIIDYGPRMVYNTTHYVEKDRYVNMNKPYECGTNIPVYSDVMGVLNASQGVILLAFSLFSTMLSFAGTVAEEVLTEGSEFFVTLIEYLMKLLGMIVSSIITVMDRAGLMIYFMLAATVVLILLADGMATISACVASVLVALVAKALVDVYDARNE